MGHLVTSCINFLEADGQSLGRTLEPSCLRIRSSLQRTSEQYIGISTPLAGNYPDARSLSCLERDSLLCQLFCVMSLALPFRLRQSVVGTTGIQTFVFGPFFYNITDRLESPVAPSGSGGLGVAICSVPFPS
jgi:hypothetical protein